MISGVIIIYNNIIGSLSLFVKIFYNVPKHFMNLQIPFFQKSNKLHRLCHFNSKTTIQQKLLNEHLLYVGLRHWGNQNGEIILSFEGLMETMRDKPLNKQPQIYSSKYYTAETACFSPNLFVSSSIMIKIFSGHMVTQHKDWMLSSPFFETKRAGWLILANGIGKKVVCAPSKLNRERAGCAPLSLLSSQAGKEHGPSWITWMSLTLLLVIEQQEKRSPSP